MTPPHLNHVWKVVAVKVPLPKGALDGWHWKIAREERLLQEVWMGNELILQAQRRASGGGLELVRKLSAAGERLAGRMAA